MAFTESSGWGTKFGMIKCRMTDIPEFQNYEYIFYKYDFLKLLATQSI